ncbi:hypothetical protein FOA52_015859 [Chlamydomonas sp. UWO 241]|nr:hypothetical protein FOA52_015859 [Chlamydomonas sp. UWO 241]
MHWPGKGGDFNEATGQVVDLFRRASFCNPWFGPSPTSIQLPRPPALMRCEPCGGLSFECGRSFKEHCCGWEHAQRMHCPGQSLPEELWDPCWDRQAWAALTPQRRYSAIHLHVEAVLAAINAPVDEAGMQRMQEIADGMRHNVMTYYRHISGEEHEEVAARCTAEAVVDAVREYFLVPEFNKGGLFVIIRGHLYPFFAGATKTGWSKWSIGETSSWEVLEAHVTGLG